MTDKSILFCSLSDRPNLSQILFEHLQSYCDKHDYKCVLENKSLCTERAPAWSKIILLQREMKNNPEVDYVVWVDDDILITNKNKKFEDFIYSNKDANIIVSEDAIRSHPMNTGIIICKNDNESMKYLQHIWQLCEKYPNSKHSGLWEQDIMTRDYRENPNGNFIKILPYRTIQTFYRTSNPDWRPTDFSAHFTGMSMDKRIQMRNDVLKIINK
jgi:hypothetical protein